MKDLWNMPARASADLLHSGHLHRDELQAAGTCVFIGRGFGKT